MARRFKKGDSVILKGNATHHHYWPELIGVSAIVVQVDSNSHITVTFNGKRSKVPSWDPEHFKLYQDGLDRILEKL